ncbi:unnamed protein product [Rotaria sp. Silwood2]|nr:unnamed protein product [Rotaria sp. Silwood2]
MKYATLRCLSYLSTISYIWLSLLKVLYLLSVREHGDPHLRGACANLLAKLIQTTIHLLTLLSLSNSFNDSFINVCSFVSIDSQDSSRLG